MLVYQRVLSNYDATKIYQDASFVGRLFMVFTITHVEPAGPCDWIAVSILQLFRSEVVPPDLAT